MDRTEYLIRDSFFTGIALGRFDAGSMLSKVGPISVAGRNELGFLDRVFGESFVITRELMYAGVYYDARNVTALEMLVRAWSKLYGSNVDNLWFKTDYAVLDDMMASANKFVKRMAKLIRSCRIYDVSDEFRLKELNVTQRECLLRLADKPSKLLEFESAICGSNRVNIREGDLIIGIRIWKCPTDLLATPVFTETGPKNLGESELLKSLYNDSYKLERSKIVISTFEKGKRKRKAITEEVLKQLAKT
jgi:HD superfamily phosphohydrolase